MNKPLTSEFNFIRQSLTNTLDEKSQRFFYATDVSPEDVGSKFNGWHTDKTFKSGNETDVFIAKSAQKAVIIYFDANDMPYGDLVKQSDLHGKKYMVLIFNTSMYQLRPENVDPAMIDRTKQDIQANYIR